MKILRIVSSGYEQGGIETHVALLQAAQEKRGHIVKIFSSDARPDMPHFNHYEYETPKGWNRFLYGAWNPHAYAALKKALKEFKPDLVDVHSIGYASPAILFLLKDYPTVLTVHSPEGYTKSLVIWCFPPSYFKGGEYSRHNLKFIGKVRYLYHKTIGDAMYQRGLKNVDSVVTLSHYMHRAMNEEGLKNTYVPIGIKLFDYQPFAKGKAPRTLAYAGRLEKIKGIDYLLEAMPAIVQRFPDAKLLIAGDGAEKARLEDLVRSLGIAENISFLGHLGRGQIEKLYQDAAIVVMPSANPETFGKVGVEAMSVGRPVIATNVGGISDWLTDGENGFLVPPKNAKAIAEAAIKIFADPAVYARMAENARGKAEEFNLEQHLDRMEEIYAQTVAPKQKDSAGA